MNTAVIAPGRFKREYVKLKRCGGCLQVDYCSRECQRADWAQHKNGCKSANPSSGGIDAEPQKRLEMDTLFSLGAVNF